MPTTRDSTAPEARIRSATKKRLEGGVDTVRTSAKLTATQARVLRHLVVGDSNKDIARALKSAPRTIEVHVANILAKLGAESRARLVASFWMRVLDREGR